MDQRELRIMAKHFYFMGQTVEETKEELDKIEVTSGPVPSIQMIQDWFDEFITAGFSVLHNTNSTIAKVNSNSD